MGETEHRKKLKKNLLLNFILIKIIYYEKVDFNQTL